MSQLRILDYRNAKYQGQYYANGKNGFGFILDENFLFVIGQWNKDILEGASIIVYPQQTIFYGYMLNGLPHQLCVYQLPNQINFYCVYDSGKPVGKIALCLNNSKRILEGEMQTKGMMPSINSKTVIEWEFITQEQKTSKLKDILKVEVKDSWRSSIKFFEQEIHKKYPELLTVSKNRNKQVCIGLKNLQSLGATFTIQGIIVSVGQYYKDFKIKDIGKRYIHTINGIIIEQGVYFREPTIVKYKKDQQRPKEILKAIKQYYKQSLDFINLFVDLKDLYYITSILKNIQWMMLDSKTNIDAQKQLEANGYTKDNPPPLDNKPVNLSRQQMLEIKKQLINQVDKIKNNSRSIRKSDTNQISYHYESPSKKNTLKTNDLPFVRNISNNPLISQSPNKYKYTQISKTPQRNTYLHRLNNSPIKYKYLQTTNLSGLTQEYQNIKAQITKSIPKNRKINPSGYGEIKNNLNTTPKRYNYCQ